MYWLNLYCFGLMWVIDPDESRFSHDDLSPYGDETTSWHLEISMILGQQVFLTWESSSRHRSTTRAWRPIQRIVSFGARATFRKSQDPLPTNRGSQVTTHVPWNLRWWPPRSLGSWATTHVPITLSNDPPTFIFMNAHQHVSSKGVGG